MPLNNPTSAQTTSSATTTQNAAGANGNGVTVTIDANTREIGITVQGASTPVMDVIFEVSSDGGSTWENAFLENLLAATGIGTLVNTVAASASKLRYRYRPAPGINAFRSRVANFVSGTVTVIATKYTG